MQGLQGATKPAEHQHSSQAEPPAAETPVDPASTVCQSRRELDQAQHDAESWRRQEKPPDPTPRPCLRGIGGEQCWLNCRTI